MFDIIIVRPYVNFPIEGGGTDRYVTLHNYALRNGLKSLLCTSNFHHNKKSFRQSSSISTEYVNLIDAGGYKSNLSLGRLLFELKFSYKTYKFIRRTETKSILIGEPLFLGWIFFLWLKLWQRTFIFGDFIDLMPEAYMVKFRFKSIFWALFSFFYFTRWFRANIFYNKSFTVSKSYTDKILIASKRVNSIFYWGISHKKIISANKNNKKIVYAGSLGEGYDIEIMIELGRQRPDLRVVIAGSGPKSELCRSAHDEGVITFLGQVDSRGLEDLYIDAFYGVLPYKKNSAVSMPIKFYEYLANGLIIINSLNMECSEVIAKYNLGCNYVPENLSSLSEAIKRTSALSIPPNVIESLMDIYSIENQYKSYITVIAELIQDGNKC